MLEGLHSRLSGVVIECLDFGDFIPRYDGQDTLFYLDPPYWGSEGDYGRDMFARADFERLAGILGTLRGRFLLSLNDRPEVRATFRDFHLSEIRTSYSIDRKRGSDSGDRAELMIANWALPA